GRRGAFGERGTERRVRPREEAGVGIELEDESAGGRAERRGGDLERGRQADRFRRGPRRERCRQLPKRLLQREIFDGGHLLRRGRGRADESQRRRDSNRATPDRRTHRTVWNEGEEHVGSPKRTQV